MTNRRTVLDAIAHRETDRVPHNVELTSDELTKVCASVGIGKGEFFAWAGNMVEKVPCNSGGEAVSPGLFRDEFGVIWDRGGADKDIGVVTEYPMGEASDGGYAFPEPRVGAIKAAMAECLDGGRDTVRLAKISFSYFERAWSLRGMERLLIDFLSDPREARRILDGILAFNLALIDEALRHDVDGFYIGDDYGQQKGLIMGPDIWREFLRPGLREMFSKIKSKGKVIAFHSCGDNREILGDFVDIGLDVYQTVQPEIYDLPSLKRDFGADLSFWGCISTQRLMPFASPAEMKDEVRRVIGIMAKGGGFIVSPTHQVPADVPPENVVAFVEVMRDRDY